DSMAWATVVALMPLRPAFLAALWMVSLARLTATQEDGAATEMPCAAPPPRVYPAGTAPDADRVAETAGFAVPGALLHDVTATPIPITTGSAKPPTLICTFSVFF